MKKFGAIEIWSLCILFLALGVAAAWAGDTDKSGAGKGRYKLIEAIKGEDYDRAKKLVAAGGGDLNAKDSNGDAPIVFAIAKRQVGLVKAMIEAGADADSKNVEGWTPLMSAVMVENAEIVKLLLDNGADPLAEARLKGVGKRTPVSLARIKKNKEILALLQAKGKSADNAGSPAQKKKNEGLPGTTSGKNPFLNDDMVSDKYYCEGSEWNEDRELTSGKFKGAPVKSDSDPEYALKGKLSVSKLFDAKGGTLYKFEFKFDSDVDSTLNYSTLYFHADEERIYEIHLPEETRDEYIRDKRLPETYETDLRCVLEDGYDNPEITGLTISVKNGICEYNKYNDGNSNFTKMEWKKGIGLVYFATGRGAHKSGMRLNIKK